MKPLDEMTLIEKLDIGCVVICATLLRDGRGFDENDAQLTPIETYDRGKRRYISVSGDRWRIARGITPNELVIPPDGWK